jgi:hypothetical protein
VTCWPQETESASSDQPECQHGVGDLGKAGDIHPCDVGAAGAVLVGGGQITVVDITREGSGRRPSHPALVVVDYLGLCDRDGGLTAEEEDATRTVDRVLRVEDAVGVAEPEEAERHDPAE